MKLEYASLTKPERLDAVRSSVSVGPAHSASTVSSPVSLCATDWNTR
jgi:hypothetical protein